MTALAAVDELCTVQDWLRYFVSRSNAAGLFFGHGSDNAWDESVYLLLHTLHLPLDRLEPFLPARLLRSEREALAAVLHQRVEQRRPAAYITGEAWLGEFRFRVDERVIVPRSYIAELLRDQFAPWIDDPARIHRALDLCTGSGCLAILLAHAFPDADVDAIDLSAAALEVAQQNIADYGLADRVHTQTGDLFAALGGRRYDLIISNPPYVTLQAMSELPQEYRHEPAMALAAGEDGMDLVRRIVCDAARHLEPGGILVVEVGHNRAQAETALPDLPLLWLDTESSSGSVFVLEQSQLP
ncbi:MAG: 50S ribosomal protein L3 N(5)-glutamine methyltransferase [Rhodocyclaceae bacterium]|nr:50S ribosomal protein L3 N(5)-glutamine methyltransferase [Rhodocyclaceae bacterium]MBX3669290.1 50S ribosomal protein L3 N(5)-glutamine methyltransferase [Rhodocyclaceae bacterium]